MLKLTTVSSRYPHEIEKRVNEKVSALHKQGSVVTSISILKDGNDLLAVIIYDEIITKIRRT